MLTEQEAQDLMAEFIRLRSEATHSKDEKIKKQFNKHKTLCTQKFDYLVTMKTGRYKAFSNYEDLKQEGREVLLKAMENFDPKKGSFFWWAHKYIDTRISRSANLHTTIRFPLKVAKENAPHKETVLPVIVEERYCPDKQLEDTQTLNLINNAMQSLTEQQKMIINLAYGFDGDKPISINKICKHLNISRSVCTRAIDTALSKMREIVKV